jgi:hypothetical protein
VAPPSATRLVLNLKTARILDREFPADLLADAIKVNE